MAIDPNALAAEWAQFINPANPDNWKANAAAAGYKPLGNEGLYQDPQGNAITDAAGLQQLQQQFSGPPSQQAVTKWLSDRNIAPNSYAIQQGMTTAGVDDHFNNPDAIARFYHYRDAADMARFQNKTGQQVNIPGLGNVTVTDAPSSQWRPVAQDNESGLNAPFAPLLATWGLGAGVAGLQGAGLLGAGAEAVGGGISGGIEAATAAGAGPASMYSPELLASMTGGAAPIADASWGVTTGGNATANGFDPLTMGEQAGNFSGGTMPTADLNALTSGSSGNSLTNILQNTPTGSLPQNYTQPGPQVVPGETGDIQVNPDGTTSPSGTQVGQTTGNTGTNTVIGPAGTAAGGGASSAISRIMDGTATTDDWLKVGGTGLSTILGMVNGSNQASALTDIANQARADRAPFLNASKGYLSDPNSFFQGPVAQGGLDAIIRKTSTRGSVSDPAQLGIMNTSLNQNYWNTVNSLGTIGLGGNIPALQTNAVNAQGNTLTNLAGGVSALVNSPQGNTLEQLLKQYQGIFDLNTGNKPI